jgi:hypothetical protein
MTGGISEQVGMGSSAGEVNISVIGTINKEPIIFNMTFGETFVIAMQKVFSVFCGQGFFHNDCCQYFINFVNVVMTILNKGKVFLEFTGKNRDKHGLTMQGFRQGSLQLRFGFILRWIKAGVFGNFTVNHIPDFLHSGNGFGIGSMIQGAIAVNAGLLPLGVLLPEIADKIKNFLHAVGGESLDFLHKQFRVGHLSYLVVLMIA